MNKYHVIEQIGNGTYGIVYKAKIKSSEETVAIKKIKRKIYLHEPKYITNEIKVLNEFSHPNVLRLYSYFKKNLSIYLVLEYMETNLLNLIENQRGVPFPDHRLKSNISQILEGVKYIHSHGYFHRDLKPENILVSDNVVKIGDFGSIKHVDIEQILSEYVSTRWYRAPEIILEDKSYTSAIDCWSIGTIAAELMLLRPLFPGSSQFDQMDKISCVLGVPGESSYGGSWKFSKILARNIDYKFHVFRRSVFEDDFASFSSEIKQFLLGLLQYDPIKRSTAHQALECFNQISTYKTTTKIPNTIKSENSFNSSDLEVSNNSNPEPLSQDVSDISYNSQSLLEDNSNIFNFDFSTDIDFNPNINFGKESSYSTYNTLQNSSLLKTNKQPDFVTSSKTINRNSTNNNPDDHFNFLKSPRLASFGSFIIEKSSVFLNKPRRRSEFKTSTLMKSVKNSKSTNQVPLNN